MKTLLRISLAGLLSAIPLAFAMNAASAAVVCNGDGDCWHTHQSYDYRPEFHLSIHPDDWHWKKGDRYTWREHEGRGYWDHGEWRVF